MNTTPGNQATPNQVTPNQVKPLQITLQIHDQGVVGNSFFFLNWDLQVISNPNWETGIDLFDFLIWITCILPNSGKMECMQNFVNPSTGQNNVLPIKINMYQLIN